MKPIINKFYDQANKSMEARSTTKVRRARLKAAALRELNEFAKFWSEEHNGLPLRLLR